MSYRLTDKDYRNFYNSIKPFVSFSYNKNEKLSQYKKNKILRYFDEISEITNQPYKITRPKSDKNKKIALKSACLKNKEYKAIPIRTAGGESAKIKYSSKLGLIKITDLNITKYFLPFEPKDLAKNTDKYLKSFFAPFPKNTLFQIKTGLYQIATAFQRDLAVDEVKNLMMRYNTDGFCKKAITERKQKEKGHHWKHWLNGVIVIEGDNFKSIRKSLTAENKNVNKEKIQRKNKRRRISAKMFKK